MQGRDLRHWIRDLKHLESYLAGILDIAHEAIISVDISQRIVIFNKGAENIFGYASEEILGQSLDVLIPKAFREAHREHVNAFREKKKQTYLMGERSGISGLRKNGEVFPAEASISRVRYGDQEIFTVILRDVTERRQMEEALRKVNEELERRIAERTRQLEERNQELQQKNMALREILEQIELEKKKIRDDVLANVETLLLPTLRKVKLKAGQSKHLELLQANLQQMVSSFGRRLSEKSFRLSPREVEICNMIRSGLESKEIAKLLNISQRTVETHRNRIRKKFNIAGKEVNLVSYLNAF